MTDLPEYFASRYASPGAQPASVEADPHKSRPDDDSSLRVAVIERRSFVRECLIRSLTQSTGWNVVAYDCADAWLAASARLPASLVVVCIGGDAAMLADGDAGRLAEIAALAPVALMADSEAPAHIVAALERNVRGYIPT